MEWQWQLCVIKVTRPKRNMQSKKTHVKDTFIKHSVDRHPVNLWFKERCEVFILSICIVAIHMDFIAKIHALLIRKPQAYAKKCNTFFLAIKRAQDIAKKKHILSCNQNCTRQS